MQKEACSIGPMSVQDNVLLTRSALFKRKRAKNIVIESQLRAKKILKEAQQEADEIRKKSYLIGYEHGLLMGGDALANFIDNSDKYAHELYQKLQQDIKALLIEVFEHEAALMKIVEGWVDEIDKKDATLPFSILIPYANRRFKKRLLDLINIRHTGGVNFEYHHEPRFVFKYKERLAEFHVEDFVDIQVENLLSQRKIYSDCHEISIKTLNELHRQIGSYLPGHQSTMLNLDNEFGEGEHDN